MYNFTKINTDFAALGTKLDSGYEARVDFIHGNLPPKPNNISVPTINGTSITEATALTSLATAGLAPGTRTAASHGGPYTGKVFSQGVAPATVVQAASKVAYEMGT